MTTSSLLLNANSWDIKLDDKGNIATTIDHYAIAQDVACAVSTFFQESIVNQQIGVDYDFDNARSIPYLTYLLEKEAKRLDIIRDAKCILFFGQDERKSRVLKGQLTVVDIYNNEIILNL